MVLTPKSSNLLPSGYALLQFFTAAFRSNDPDSGSEDDDDSTQRTDNDESCSTRQEQRSDIAFRTDSNNAQHDQDEAVSYNRAASHDASHGNANQTNRTTTSGFLLGSPHDKDAVAQKLREVFGYSDDEMLIEEYSCWMARSVLLPGYMYLTTNHVCFYANLPSSHDVVQKEGYFSKRSSTTKTLNRYWFVLKNDILSYYKDQSDIYYPIKTINLKDALSAEPSLVDDLAFNVHTRSRKHKFKTDSEMARTEWVKAIQKSIFHAKTDEDNVKISIPLANIMAVELNSTSFADTIRMEIMDMDDMEDELYFAYFEDTPETHTMLKSRLDEYKKTSEYGTGKDLSTLRFMDSTSPAPDSHRKSLATEQPQGPLASSLSGPQQSETSRSASSVSWLLSPLKYLHPSYAFSDGRKGNSSVPRTTPEVERKSGAKDKGTLTNSLPRGPVTWTAENSPDIRSGSSGGIQMVDAGQQLTYSKEFSLPEGESLAETFSGYLLRVLPVYGKIYLSDNYVCFKSTMYGSSTRVVLPLADVTQVDKHHGTRFYFHGLVVSIKTGEEIFFEFSNSETRSTALKALRDRITSEAQERRKEYRAQAVRETTALELDDPMESRVMDSLQLREEPVQGEPMSLALHPSFRPSRILHITCLTIGSRGDVQPYIALCKRLMEDGHTCRIATHGEYKDWIEGHGIEFGYVGGDPGELIELCVDNGMFTVSFIREGLKRFRGWLDDLMNTAWDACQNTDVLIESPSAMAGIHIAEALDIPYFRALPFPWTRTRAFPHPFAVPERNLGRGYNYMTYAMIEQVFWKGISGRINKWRRRKLGLPSTSLEKLNSNSVPCLYSWSPSLVPAPMDWHSWIHVTGFWFLDNPDLDWTPPEGLEEFLDAEPDSKPVYIGFGSMVVADPEDMTRTIVDAVVKAGVRAVICKGWSDKLSTQDSGAVDVVQEFKGEEKRVYPSSVYMIKSVPHDWLFPRVAGVVHHGGAGTTAAGLRAGIPTVIKPYFGDQYFWAQRVEDAGVGVWCRDLTVKKLAAALETITKDQKMIQKSQAMGETIRAEDGVGKAVQYFYHDLVLAKQQLEKRKKEKEKADKDNRTTIVSKVRAVASSTVTVSSGDGGQENDRWLPGLSMTRKSKDGNDGCTTEKDEQQESRSSISSIRVSEETIHSGCAHDPQHSSQEDDVQPKLPSEAEASTKHLHPSSVEPDVDHTTQHQCRHGKSQVNPGSHESNSFDGSDSSDDSESDSQLDGGQVKKSKARRVLGKLASKAKKLKDHLRSPGNLNDNAKCEHCAEEGLKEE